MTTKASHPKFNLDSQKIFYQLPKKSQNSCFQKINNSRDWQLQDILNQFLPNNITQNPAKSPKITQNNNFTKIIAENTYQLAKNSFKTSL